MNSRTIRGLLLVIPLILLGACAPAEEGEEEAEADTAAVDTAAEAAMPTPPPDTTAAAVWAHLQAESFHESWSLWPDKGELYQGQEPHGALLTTYLNPLALDAVTNRAGTLPPGAIIVKENFAPDSTLAATTVMYKASGYDAEHGDWWWMKRLADGTVEAQGRVQGCIDCHGGAADNDYIMTGPIR